MKKGKHGQDDNISNDIVRSFLPRILNAQDDPGKIINDSKKAKASFLNADPSWKISLKIPLDM